MVGRNCEGRSREEIIAETIRPRSGGQKGKENE